MLDILLVDPPYTSLKRMAVDRGYNIGLTSLAAYLRQAGFQSGVVTGDLIINRQTANAVLFSNVKKYASGQKDYQRIVKDQGHPVWEKMKNIIRQSQPRAVGIAYLTPLKYVVERIAELTKEVDPEIKVIAGSFHPTFCPEEVMQNKNIDFLVRGEGEIPLLLLMQEFKKARANFESIPGITFRDSAGNLKSNACSDYIHNLDELPFPARDLVLNCDYRLYPAHALITSRGCPYSCSFCSDKRLWNSTIRRRSVENVLQEVQIIKQAYPNLDYIDIVDGTFTYDRKYLTSFCHEMIARKLSVPWRCTARYDNLDKSLLDLMKRANCTGLYLGMESGSDRILKMVDKRIKIEDILNVSRMVYESGINSATAVLLGLPEENKDDAKSTLGLMKKIKTDIFDINSYIPLPGTAFYDVMSESDRTNIDWYKVGYKSFDNYFTRNMTANEFQAYRNAAYRIARNVQIKSILRLGPRVIFSKVTKNLRILLKTPSKRVLRAMPVKRAK
jgi:anaerobic magnesium-protoporphyrin IX monomethyl ester cyclase